MAKALETKNASYITHAICAQILAPPTAAIKFNVYNCSRMDKHVHVHSL
ncbi:hypothetical protein [Polaromonas vacuolata]|nr:hypothetical protein [Polaromonas vacuolata]